MNVFVTIAPSFCFAFSIFILVWPGPAVVSAVSPAAAAEMPAEPEESAVLTDASVDAAAAAVAAAATVSPADAAAAAAFSGFTGVGGCEREKARKRNKGAQGKA